MDLLIVLPVITAIITAAAVYMLCRYVYVTPFHYEYTVAEPVKKYLRACEKFLSPFASLKEVQNIFASAKQQIVKDYSIYMSAKQQNRTSELEQYYIDLFENDAHYNVFLGWASLYIRYKISLPKGLTLIPSDIEIRYQKDFKNYLDEIRQQILSANGEFCPISFVENFLTQEDIRNYERTGQII